jgi:opine dehydrogenase
VVTTPAVGHEYLAKGIANALTDGQRILLNPGHTGGALHFANSLRQAGCRAAVQLCETVTLTYICRMPQFGRVEVYRRTTNLRCAAFPGKFTAALVPQIQSVFANIVPAANVMETGLANINAIMHPAGMLGNAGWIEQSGGDFLYYREGITPAIGAWIDAVDRERLEIVRRLGLPAYQAIHNSEANLRIKAPPALDHRYIREDVGYGLVPMAEVGKLLAVKTPVMDALITLASKALGVDFLAEGLTLGKMGLEGVSADRLPALLNDGF